MAGAHGRLPPERLLAEVDDLLRTLPAAEEFKAPATVAWIGRAQAVVAAWNPVALPFANSTTQFLGGYGIVDNHRAIAAFLHRVRYDLVLQTSDVSTKVVSKGEPFGYFDEVRKLVQRARKELFFVDPYLTDEFVSLYMPSVAPGTVVRLLGRENIGKLRPAVEVFRAQSGLAIDVRSGSGFHDRFLFLDGVECYQSSASFHQGGKSTPAVLTPMLDAAPALRQVYEAIWSAGK